MFLRDIHLHVALLHDLVGAINCIFYYKIYHVLYSFKSVIPDPRVFLTIYFPVPLVFVGYHHHLRFAKVTYFHLLVNAMICGSCR